MIRYILAALLIAGPALGQSVTIPPVTGTPGNIVSIGPGGVAGDSGAALSNVPQFNFAGAWSGLQTFNGGFSAQGTITLGNYSAAGGATVNGPMSEVTHFYQPTNQTIFVNQTDCLVSIPSGGTTNGSFPCLQSTITWTGSGNATAGSHGVAGKFLSDFEGTGTLDHTNVIQNSISMGAAGTITTVNLALDYLEGDVVGSTIGTLNGHTCATPNPAGIIGPYNCLYMPAFLPVTAGGTLGTVSILNNQEPSAIISTVGPVVVSGAGTITVSSVPRVSDNTLPVQVNAASGTQAYFGATKAGAYGVLFGYNNSTGFSGPSAQVRNITNDPLDFLVNNSGLTLRLNSDKSAVFYGHMGFTGTTPGVSSCGTSPTIVGSDMRGTVTEGSSATSCTITFNTSFATAPYCIISSPNGAPYTGYTTSVSNLVISNASASGNEYTWHCEQ